MSVCVSLPLVEPLTDVSVIMFRAGAALADDNSCSNGYCDYNTCVVGDRCPFADRNKLAGPVEMKVELGYLEMAMTSCGWTLELNNSTSESLVG